MEVITYNVGVVSRGKGRSAVQLAAYCARDKLHNAYTGVTYDYTERSDLVFSQILLPQNAPSAFADNAILWNAVERRDTARNARLARIVYFSLPKEVDHHTQIEMTRSHVQHCFVDNGMCAAACIHDKGDGNPHVHVLLTTRSLDTNGEWMGKQRRNYLLDENGARIRDPKTGRYLLGRSIKINDWDDYGKVEQWRRAWAEACNREFERLGIEKRVTHLSYARQGIDREPTKHLGARAKALEDRGILTDRGNKNREIKARDEQRQRSFYERQHDYDHDFDRSR